VGDGGGRGREGGEAGVIKPGLQPQSHYYSQWQVDHNIITAGRMVEIHTDNNYPKNPRGWLTRVRE